MRLPVVSLAVLLAAATAVASSAATAPPPKPRLVLSDVRPATVRGAHFASSEQVRLRFSAGGDASTAIARTSGAGTFVATAPPSFGYSPCGAPLVVRAIGAGGDHATLRVPQRECPAP